MSSECLGSGKTERDIGLVQCVLGVFVFRYTKLKITMKCLNKMPIR